LADAKNMAYETAEIIFEPADKPYSIKRDLKFCRIKSIFLKELTSFSASRSETY